MAEPRVGEVLDKSLVRAGDPRIEARTQDSIAVSATGDRWLVVNASPDVLRQIERFPPLQPRRPRDTPIAAVALTNGDLAFRQHKGGHTTGPNWPTFLQWSER